MLKYGKEKTSQRKDPQGITNVISLRRKKFKVFVSVEVLNKKAF